MKTSWLSSCAGGLATLCLPTWVVAQVQLITVDEASRPDGQYIVARAVTRGPSILLESPREVPAAGFTFKLALEAKGGALIDARSLKVEYIKEPSADLTQRIATYFQANKLEIAQARVPPGKHTLRISIKDSEGRQSSQIIQLEAH